MNVTVENVSEPVLVTIICTHGDLDASNYLDLVAKAKQVYEAGARDLLIDLQDTPYLSSSGIVALHSIALLVKGEKPHDPEESGWNVLHAVGKDVDAGIRQKHVKLLNPQPRVDKTLDGSGLKDFFDVFTDRTAALASFSAENTQTPAS